MNVRAYYQGGTFHLHEPVDLHDGTEVELSVHAVERDGEPHDDRAASRRALQRLTQGFHLGGNALDRADAHHR